MRRPHFETGRILRTADFVAEQAYHLGNHRRHQVTAHRWGVAAGLAMTELDAEMVVGPGVAIDGFGRDIVLDNARTLDLREFRLRAVESVDVWVGFDQRRIVGGEDRVDLLLDTAFVELTDAADVDPRRPPGVDAADLDHPGSTAASDSPLRRWPVYLGRITLDLADPSVPPTVETDRRPWIGLVGAGIQTPDGTEWLSMTEGEEPAVGFGPPGAAGQYPVTIRAASGVHLDASLTVDGDVTLRGGSLALPPPDSPATTAMQPAPEWSIGHHADGVAHELRIAMPHSTATEVPRRLVVGVWQDDTFVRRLVIDEDGTVIVAGNLVVNGRLSATSVQEAEIGADVRTYLSGLQGANLLSLFALTDNPQ